MPGKRYTEEQIIRVLNEAQAGKTAKDVCREHGISEKTFYHWRSKYGGMTVSDARKLKVLEDENRRLKAMVAEQALDIQALKEISSKNW